MARSALRQCACGTAHACYRVWAHHLHVHTKTRYSEHDLVIWCMDLLSALSCGSQTSAALPPSTRSLYPLLTGCDRDVRSQPCDDRSAVFSHPYQNAGDVKPVALQGVLYSHYQHLVRSLVDDLSTRHTIFLIDVAGKRGQAAGLYAARLHQVHNVEDVDAWKVVLSQTSTVVVATGRTENGYTNRTTHRSNKDNESTLNVSVAGLEAHQVCTHMRGPL